MADRRLSRGCVCVYQSAEWALVMGLTGTDLVILVLTARSVFTLGLRGKARGGARVTAGPKRPHLSVCPPWGPPSLTSEARKLSLQRANAAQGPPTPAWCGPAGTLSILAVTSMPGPLCPRPCPGPPSTVARAGALGRQALTPNFHHFLAETNKAVCELFATFSA